MQIAIKGALNLKKLRTYALKVTLGIILLSITIPLTQCSTGWLKIYQGGSLDVLTPLSMIQTSDSGYAIAVFGYIRQESSQGLTSSYELQILRTDSNGATLWKKSYLTVNDPSNFTPAIDTYSDQYAIVQTADGGFVIAGGSGQFWLFKVSSQGTVVWSRIYQLNDEASANSYLYSMIQTSDGGFALAGAVDTLEGAKDYWLVKTNSQGVAQWNQTFNSGTYTDQIGTTTPCDDYAQGIIQSNDGGFVLVGTNSLFRASTSSIVYASWVVKTDAQGKQLWNQGYDWINEQGYKRYIIQTSDNGYAVAGTQNNDFCLFKISGSGQFQWSKIYGEQETDVPCGLVQLADNGYGIAGTWTPINTTYTRSTVGLLRTDSTGQTLWTKTYSAKETTTAFSIDQANVMIQTKDGSYAIAGSTTFGTENHQDIFFVKTETLEQPPQTTPLPDLSSSETNPTQIPYQTTQPSSGPTQNTQTQNPNPMNTPTGSSDNGIFQIDSPQNILLIAGIIVVLAAISVLLIVFIGRKKSSRIPPPP